MGIKVTTDVFQATLGELFGDLNSMVVYLDDILVIWACSHTEHLAVVSEVLRRLEAKGKQVNPEKEFLSQIWGEMFGFPNH